LKEPEGCIIVYDYKGYLVNQRGECYDKKTQIQIIISDHIVMRSEFIHWGCLYPVNGYTNSYHFGKGMLMKRILNCLLGCMLVLGGTAGAGSEGNTSIVGETHIGDPRAYGAVYDGLYDCAPAINECIQNHKHVKLRGEGVALCRSTIMVKSDTWLELDRDFTIKLADNANTVLIKNKWAEQAYFMEKNLINGAVPTFMAEIYPDYGSYPSTNYILGAAETNIRITGGIFDGNGGNNSRKDHLYGCVGFVGVLLQIVNVRGFEMEGVTLKDACTYNAEFCMLSEFFINNITLKFGKGRPNIDGIHFEGDCYKGTVQNIFGRTNDDMVTFNGGDSWYPGNHLGTPAPEAKREWFPFRQGAIKNITVKNIFATDGYRAVRLLSNIKREGLSPATETEGMDDILIDGIYGDFRVDCVLISKHYNRDSPYGHITVKNVHATSTGVNNINIHNVSIDSLVLDSIRYVPTNSSKNFIVNKGNIKSLMIRDTLIDGKGEDLSAKTVINNTGTINKLKLINVTQKDANYSGLIDKATPTESLMSDY